MADEHPLFETKEAAFNAEGELYLHYKGGVYRLIQRGVKNSETLEPGVVYEHLWPYDHAIWYRPEKEFFENMLDGTPRFRLIKKD